MSGRIFGFAALCSVLLASFVAKADYNEAIEGLEAKPGLIDTFVDAEKGKILLSLRPQTDGSLGRYIYAGYLTAGLGSNPVGLDRSRPSDSHILSFKRAGGKVMAVVENHRYRASADNLAEKKAVETSFAQSVIWSTDVIENSEKGEVLIDISGFLKRDAVGVAAQLKNRGQGAFKVDLSRSFVDTAQAHVFPENLEFDAHVTFATNAPGREVRATTPVPNSVSLILHTTFLKLPDAGYAARIADQRAGVVTTSHIDMSAPLAGNTAVQLARRFRLEIGADGTVTNPIIFYIDNGAPEPIRSALLDGARWWSDAFDAAGFKGGYRAEILPDGVHPLDARYNVVNWVHRATRGWSYGASIFDPRTGEILRGVVLLGSLRVRQDIKIFEALAGAQNTGSGRADDPVELALARIRQLSAHEIGHSLGFSHNMAASSYGRESVMDYPAPDVRLDAAGALDFSQAYGVGIGAWDKWVTKYLYGAYDDSDPAQKRALFREADAGGLLYVADSDSRSPGSGHVRGSLWDNGTDAVNELNSLMEVRAKALEGFGEKNLRPGEHYSALQTKFVPLYLYHRYQLQAAAKFIGGYDFVYRAEGDGRPAPVPVSNDEQMRALSALTATLSPEALLINEQLAALLSPRGGGGGDPQFGREAFAGSAAPGFSTEEAVAAAADLVFDALLHPRRLQRLAEQGHFDADSLDITAMTAFVSRQVMQAKRGEAARATAVRAIVLERMTQHLIEALHDPDTGLLVRSGVRTSLLNVRRLAERARGSLGGYTLLLVQRIDDAFARAKTPAVKTPAGPTPPPGSPIGSGSSLGTGDAETCWHC